MFVDDGISGILKKSQLTSVINQIMECRKKVEKQICIENIKTQEIKAQRGFTEPLLNSIEAKEWQR